MTINGVKQRHGQHGLTRFRIHSNRLGSGQYIPLNRLVGVLLPAEYMCAMKLGYATFLITGLRVGEQGFERNQTNRTGVCDVDILFAQHWQRVYEDGNTVLDGGDRVH